ncbi:oxidoreductase [marine bacterium AO1-C]|nr:oxidoreductase [marine bacterium AO1-C]
MNQSKTILITGASTGIGYGCVKEFHRRGYHVFGSVRKPADAERLQSEMPDRFTPLLFDVANPEAIQEAVQTVAQFLGEGQGLGGLINNAGVAIGGPLMLQSMEEIRQHFEVNVFGMIQVTKAFLPLLGAKPNHPVAPGKIMNISSVGGKIAAPFIGAYASTKHAVEGLSESWRRELLLYGIDVIIIGPGAVKTPIWDKGINVDKYKETPYGESSTNFANYARGESEKGLTLEFTGKRIANIFEKRKPKVRYAIVPQRMTNWTIPRLLPKRLIDRVIGKQTGLIKKK